MTNSMTGYARVEENTEFGRLQIELRSVNHRYLEVTLRMPEELRVHEANLRTILSSKLNRGKIDCNIRLDSSASTVLATSIDQQQLQAVNAMLDAVHESRPTLREANSIDVLRWPGVVREAAPDADAMATVLYREVERATETLFTARQEEGERMAALIEQRLDALEPLLSVCRDHQQQCVSQLREKWLERLSTLEVEPDSSRLEQEMVIAAQKMDIAEELDRLDSHILAAKDALSSGEPVGRRLDFLMQEFNREVNTIGSKAAQSQMTDAVVEMKVLIEQMREQIQNIE